MNCGNSTNLLPCSRAGRSGIRLHSRLSTVEQASLFMNLIGKRFGRWIVLSRSEEKRKWNCKCDCGTFRAVSEQNLSSGFTTSCGCWKNEKTSARCKTHGMTRTPEHQTWLHMRARCENPNDCDYADYGGRGIRVCDRWKSFSNFYADMGPRPDGFEIDRISNDGNYEPNNCRWANRFTQMQNTRLTRHLTLNGKTLCLAQWSRELGISTATLSQRLQKWTLERALSTPKLK